MIMSEIDLPTLSKWVVTWVGGGSGVHYGMRNSLSLSRSLASISSGNTIPDKHALSFSLSLAISLSLSLSPLGRRDTQKIKSISKERHSAPRSLLHPALHQPPPPPFPFRLRCTCCSPRLLWRLWTGYDDERSS